MSEENEQSIRQKKIFLAGSEHASTIIELMKDCMTQGPLIDDKSQWKTNINAITLDVQGEMLKNMVDHLEAIRKGSLHNPEGVE